VHLLNAFTHHRVRDNLNAILRQYRQLHVGIYFCEHHLHPADTRFSNDLHTSEADRDPNSFPIKWSKRHDLCLGHFLHTVGEIKHIDIQHVHGFGFVWG
tara:strand:- start:200 stop:496 length:297 start_codon:yes stop_codon:yes gene_type:complete